MSRSAIICRTAKPQKNRGNLQHSQWKWSTHAMSMDLDGLILNLIGFHFSRRTSWTARMESWRGMAKQWGAKGTMQTWVQFFQAVRQTLWEIPVASSACVSSNTYCMTVSPLKKSAGSPGFPGLPKVDPGGSQQVAMPQFGCHKGCPECPCRPRNCTWDSRRLWSEICWETEVHTMVYKEMEHYHSGVWWNEIRGRPGSDSYYKSQESKV